MRTEDEEKLQELTEKNEEARVITKFMTYFVEKHPTIEVGPNKEGKLSFRSEKEASTFVSELLWFARKERKEQGR